jgi:hypothetical protein
MAALAFDSLFGQSLSLVHLFEQYVYPRPIVFADDDLAVLSRLRFGHGISYPRKWLRYYFMNNAGTVVQDPDHSEVAISIYGSFFSGNPESSIYDGNEETLDQYVQWKKEGTSTLVSFHYKTCKVTMSGLVDWMPPIEKMQPGYWWEENGSDGNRYLEFVTKSNGVWHFLVCEAPRALYPRYREFFFRVLDSFQIAVDEDTDRLPALDEQEMRSAPEPP